MYTLLPKVFAHPSNHQNQVFQSLPLPQVHKIRHLGMQTSVKYWVISVNISVKLWYDATSATSLVVKCPPKYSKADCQLYYKNVEVFGNNNDSGHRKWWNRFSGCWGKWCKDVANLLQSQWLQTSNFGPQISSWTTDSFMEWVSMAEHLIQAIHHQV